MTSSDYQRFLQSIPRKSRSTEFTPLVQRTEDHSPVRRVVVTRPWPMSQNVSERHLREVVPQETHNSMLKTSCSTPHCSLGHRKINRPLSIPLTEQHIRQNSSEFHRPNLGGMESYNISKNSGPFYGMNSSQNFVTTSTTSCIPWFNKKTMKKIQKKIGIGRGDGLSQYNQPPLLFHSNHGENVQILQGGKIARRFNSFCKGIAFSDRPVKVNEKIYIKFSEVATHWSGVIRFGFTNHDPSSIRSLPKYSCPDLTSRPGFWAKAFLDSLVQTDSILFYYVTPNGDVRFGIDGEEKGVFFKEVDTRTPLWALVDIYGNSVSLEFLDLNNSREQLNNSGRNSTASCSGISEFMVAGFSSPSPYYEPIKKPSTVHFHETHGKNIELKQQCNIAIRRGCEYINAYVFVSRPIRIDETIVLRILKCEPSYTGSLTMGITSCDPCNISSLDLPDDSLQLLDRPEYWVIMKDVGGKVLEPGDELGFTTRSSGAVELSKNGGSSTTIMHIDNSIPLFLFFDLYGSTQVVSLLGSFERRQLDRTTLPTQVTTTTVERNPMFHNDHAQPGNSKLVKVRGPNGKWSLQPLTPINSTNNLPQEEPHLSIECVACLDRQVDSVLYSCGHMVFCMECALQYWKIKKQNTCPICRAPITDIIKTYKS